MSKLKTAKAIHATLVIAADVLKWVALVGGVGIVIALLWAWANAHFLSFAIVIGIVVAFLILAAIIGLWEWSSETIEEAQKEERRAQERNRVEKERKENPGKYIPFLDDDEAEADPHGYGGYMQAGKPRKF